MTFDETIEKFEQEANEYNGLVPMETVYELILDLRDKYAPTVEMTKEQYKIFSEDIQLNQKALDGYLDKSTGLSKITNRQALNLYTHPETIKIIDE